VPLAVVALVMALVFANGWHRQLTLENIVAVRDRFQLFLADHRLLAVIAYIAAYTVAVALSLPGALLITIAGGLMFGWLLGGTAAVIGASCGAILLYLVAKTAFGDTLRAKAGPALGKLIDGFKSDALNYLLFLRLVPAFPFFIVNIAAALLGVPFRTYVLGTVLGIIPATFAFASVGAGLDSVVAAAKIEHAACIAARGVAACRLTINPGTLVTRELLIAFALLGLIALIPVALRKWSNRRG
jgi:uncharacterized membrane protein YdjX (TVP38/TMEM64 family)